MLTPDQIQKMDMHFHRLQNQRIIEEKIAADRVAAEELLRAHDILKSKQRDLNERTRLLNRVW